jgi:L-malate glycosyltransferase
MKILWFTNIPLPGHSGAASHSVKTSGGWMLALLEELQTHVNYKLAVATVGKINRVIHRCVDNVDYFIVPQHKHLFGRAALDQNLDNCNSIIRKWKPDVIHIHGTERFYGLLSARQYSSVPTVISLQGLLGPYSQWQHYFGNRSLQDIMRMHRLLELPLLRGQWAGFRQYRRAARREREIIEGNRFFMGRTAWDRAYLLAVNPEARYFHAGELLRQSFWKARWELNAVQRHRIVVSGAGHPRKGVETLLDAASLLQHDFSDVQVGIMGWISKKSGYGRYIRRHINGMHGLVAELGQLNAEEISIELARSHVFASPSFIDNSPNAVCEAQLLGMPVLSTYTGGVPSLIEEGETGLLFPPGDAPMLAARLRQVFEDDALAVDLGKQSHVIASRRHDPESVVRQVLAAYEDVFLQSM